jgi:hypothetical protein
MKQESAGTKTAIHMVNVLFYTTTTTTTTYSE